MFALLLAAALPSAEMQDAVKEAVGRQLKDPYSAQYEWQPIKSETLYCGWVNAKNSFGAYGGFTPFAAIYMKAKSGPRVFAVDLDPRLVNSRCIEAGYTVSR